MKSKMNDLIMKFGDEFLRHPTCKICLAEGTSLWEWTTGTSAIYMTSALDTTTSTLAEMTTSTSLMNGTKFALLLFVRLFNWLKNGNNVA